MKNAFFNRFFYKLLAIALTVVALSACMNKEALLDDLTPNSPNPKKSKLTISVNKDKVNLKWNAVEGVKKYTVYYSADKDFRYQNQDSSTVKQDVGTVTSQDIDKLSNGKTYYFVVTGTDGSNKERVIIEKAKVTLAPSAPMVTATSGYKKVTLTWSKVEGATSYKVYQSTSASADITGSVVSATITGDATKSAKVSGLTNGTPYYFKVVAVNDGSVSEPSNEESATPSFSAPSISKITAGDKSVTLEWENVDGATSYEVHQSTEENFVVADANKVKDPNVNITATGATQSAKVSDFTNSAKSAKDYYFAVVAVNSSIKSDKSNEVSVTTITALNDTGIMLAAKSLTENSDKCTYDKSTTDAINANQDCNYGRDARAADLNKVGDGRAGFDFTKIGGDGQELPKDAPTWSCVRDNHTRLLWEVKTKDGGIHDADNTYKWGKTETDWKNLVKTSNDEALCGRTNWRAPTVSQLLGIFDYGSNKSPFIDTAYFPHTQAGSYWTSFKQVGVNTTAWPVNFSENTATDGTPLAGTSLTDPIGKGNYLRLVSGAPLYDVSHRYKDNDNGTVTDTQTDLTWKVCSEGQMWSQKDGKLQCTGTVATFNWPAALEQAKTVNESNAGMGFAERTNWRVPNVKELSSLVAYDKNPTINSTFFPNTPLAWYWSSSPSVINSKMTWVVGLIVGNVTAHARSDSIFHSMRLVSSNQ